MDERTGTRIKMAGNILVVLGVGVWGVYALLRLGLGWDVNARAYLPYHLAGVVPGMILKRHRFFLNMVSRFFS